MNQDRSYRSLDFGSCQIRVLRVNDAPASFPVPTLETPEQGYAFWQEHIATSAWFTPDQECLTSILLNVRYAVIRHLSAVRTGLGRTARQRTEHVVPA